MPRSRSRAKQCNGSEAERSAAVPPLHTSGCTPRRQNVIFELGFFFGALGRSRTASCMRMGSNGHPTSMESSIFHSMVLAAGSCSSHVNSTGRASGLTGVAYANSSGWAPWDLAPGAHGPVRPKIDKIIRPHFVDLENVCRRRTKCVLPRRSCSRFISILAAVDADRAAVKVSRANDALTRALIVAAARGIRPRCGDYETSYLWLSEEPGERRLAALMCAGCVVWAECSEVGQHQRFGVWGGRDTTVRPGKRLQRVSEAA
jgi:hypothetical protein